MCGIHEKNHPFTRLCFIWARLQFLIQKRLLFFWIGFGWNCPYFPETEIEFFSKTRAPGFHCALHL